MKMRAVTHGSEVHNASGASFESPEVFLRND